MDDSFQKVVLFAWQGKIYESKLSLCNHNVSISSWHWVLSCGWNTFGPPVSAANGALGGRAHGKETLPVTVSCKNCQNIQIISKKTVRDFRTGLYTPFILLRIVCSDIIKFCLLQIQEDIVKLSSQVELRQKTQYEFRDVHQSNYALIDGPNVIILRQGKMHLLNLMSGSDSGLQSSLILPDIQAPPFLTYGQNDEVKLLGYSSLHPPKIAGTMQYLLLLSVPKELLFTMEYEHATDLELPSTHRALTYVVTLPVTMSLGSMDISLERIKKDRFVPDIYCSLVDKIIFSKLKRTSSGHTESYQQPQLCMRQDRSYESEISLITTMGQLIVFKNCKLSKCCSLPNRSQDLALFENNIDQKYYCLLDEKGNAIVIDAKDLKIEHTFKGVSELLVDDFINSGGEQILLVNSEEAESSPPDWNKFILTDCLACKIVRQDAEKVEVAAESEEGIHGAVRALENRLQTGINYLSGVRCELESKMRLLHNISSNMHDANLGFNRTLPKEGLVPLLGNESSQNSKHPGAGDAHVLETPVEISISVYNKWQRIFDNSWVIGMNIKNSINWRLSNITASLVTSLNDVEISSRSQIFTFHRWVDDDLQNTDSGLPRSKKPRLVTKERRDFQLPTPLHHLDPEEVAQLVILTNLPCFTEEDTFTVTLLLSWNEAPAISGQLNRNNVCSGKSVGESTELIDSVFTEKRCILTIGNIELRVIDLLDGKLLLDVERLNRDDFESHLVLEMTQKKQSLVVSSLHHRITDCCQLFHERLGFIWSECLHCWVHVLKDGPLKHTRVYVKEEEHRRFKFTLYYRDDVQLSVFLHALYKQLSDDAIILSEDAGDPMSAVSRVLQAVLDETRLVQDTCKESQGKDVDVGLQVGTSNMDTSTKEGVELLRENFARKQKRLKCVNVDKYEPGDMRAGKRVMDSLTLAEEKTDLRMDEMIFTLKGINLT